MLRQVCGEHFFRFGKVGQIPPQPPLVVNIERSPRRRRSWSSSWQEAEVADDAAEVEAEHTSGRPTVVRTLSKDQPTQTKIKRPFGKRPIFQNTMFRCCCSEGIVVCEQLSVVDSVAALGEEESSSELPCPAEAMPSRKAQKTVCVGGDLDFLEAEPGGTALSKPDMKPLNEAMAEGPIIQRVLAVSAFIPSMCKTSQLEALDIMQKLVADLLEQGQLEVAIPLGTQILELREACLGPQHMDTLRSAASVGSMLEDLGKLAEAGEYYQRALQGFEQKLGSDHILTLECVSNVICLLETQGKLLAAELMSTSLLQTLDAVLGAEHPNSARCASNLACILENQGRFDEAESLYRRAAQSFQDAWGPTHPETVGSIYCLACVLEARGDFKAALPYLRFVLSCNEASLGKLHPETLGSLYNLATLLETMDQADEAEELFYRELEGCIQLLGRGHTAVDASVHNLVRFLEKRGKRQEARDIESQFRT